MFRTNVPCSDCGKMLEASDECRTMYPGIHGGYCECGVRTPLYCINGHNPDDFFQNRGEAVNADWERRNQKK